MTMERLNQMSVVSQVQCYVQAINGMIFRDKYALRMLEREISRYNQDTENIHAGSRAVLLLISGIPIDVVFTKTGKLKHIILVVNHSGRHELYNSPYDVIVEQIAYPSNVTDLADILNKRG